METVLADNSQHTQTYTGNPNKWPNGLYKGFTSGTTYYANVRNGYALVWTSEGEVIRPGTFMGGQYTKIPGYTGRIKSITPLFVGVD